MNKRDMLPALPGNDFMATVGGKLRMSTQLPRVPKPPELAAMMRLFRQRKSLTAAEAGKWLGISGRTVENIEQSRGFGNPRTLALAMTLLVSQKIWSDPLA